MCVALYIGLSSSLFAEEKIKPEQLLEEHLKALGSPEILQQIKTRLIIGVATMKYITGGSGQLAGKANWASEKRKMGFVIQFGARDYPGEHFAYDSKDVMVNYIQTNGQRSEIGNFLLNYDGIMKNGLLGGVLTVDWPLLNIQESKLEMKIKKKKVDDRELYEVEYLPNKSMEDVKVKMYFDPKTHYHVMTEYRLYRYSFIAYPSRLGENIENHILIEKFEDFKSVDGVNLPHKYSLNYQLRGAMQVLYTFDAEKIVHNRPIDPQFYVAQK